MTSWDWLQAVDRGDLLAYAGLTFVLLFLVVVPRRFLLRRPTGTFPPGLTLTPVEYAVLSGSGHTVVALTLMELRDAGVLDLTGRVTGFRPAPGTLSPAAQALDAELRAQSGRVPDPKRAVRAVMRAVNKPVRRRLVALGLARSGEPRAWLAPLDLLLKLTGGALLLVFMVLLFASLGFGMVFAVLPALSVLMLVRPRRGLTPHGKEMLGRARLHAQDWDPRAGRPFPSDPPTAALAVSILGVGALYAIAPGLAAAAGPPPAAALAAELSRPPGTNPRLNECGGSGCGSDGPPDGGCSGSDGGCGGGCGGD